MFKFTVYRIAFDIQGCIEATGQTDRPEYPVVRLARDEFARGDHGEGLGSTNLPQQYPGESSRAWKRRCRLAKVFLVHDFKANIAGVAP